MKRVLFSLLMSAFVSALAADVIEPCERIYLFTEEDPDAWTVYLRDGDETAGVFSAKDGILHCVGEPYGYIRTIAEYKNYRLNVEWRWVDDPGNSGVLLHTQEPDKVWPECIEAQLRSGNAGDFIMLGGTSIKQHDGPGIRLPMFGESNELPAGEWNRYEIYCMDDGIYISVNGELKNVATEASLTSGTIALQSEGAPVQFRNVYIEPITRAED